MEPIYPMEPVASDTIPKGEEWIANIKWDGVRILSYYDGLSVSLLNRKCHIRTSHYPELIDIHSFCDAQSVILDGEVIALGSDGKPSFHEVMRRDGLRRMDKVDFVKKRVPIAYMIFDVIFYNGSWLTKAPYLERMDVLNNIIHPNESVQIVAPYENGNDLFRVIQGQNMEGIVIKQRNSLYLPGEKKDTWRKIKNYKDIIAVIGGFTMRDGIVNSILVGVYQNDDLYYIGHVGTGKLSSQEWRQLTQRLLPTVILKKPFVNAPVRRTGVSWTVPTVSVKIQFIEWTEGHSLRQPSIQAIVDASPKDCVL